MLLMLLNVGHSYGFDRKNQGYESPETDEEDSDEEEEYDAYDDLTYGDDPNLPFVTDNVHAIAHRLAKDGSVTERLKTWADKAYDDWKADGAIRMLFPDDRTIVVMLGDHAPSLSEFRTTKSVDVFDIAGDALKPSKTCNRDPRDGSKAKRRPAKKKPKRKSAWPDEDEDEDDSGDED